MRINELERLENDIVQWGKEKGILDKATPLAQWKKTQEELTELHESLNAQNNGLKEYINSKGEKVNTYDQILDDCGDIGVTLILQCALQETNLTEALTKAWNVISKRTGKMINGQFVKDE